MRARLPRLLPLLGTLIPLPVHAFTVVGGRPNSGQELELLALETLVRAEVAVELGASGSAHYLASTNLAPGCAARTVATAQDAEAVVACFFQRYPALFSEGAEDTRVVPRTAVGIGSPSLEGTQVVRVHQRYGSVNVRGSEVAFVLENGVLISYMGRLFPPSRVPPPAR